MGGPEPDDPDSRLWKRWVRSRERPVRDRLLERYAFMVRYAVERVGSALPPRVLAERRGDMISAGTLGLMDAVDRYSPGRGAKFETYGSRRVHGAVVDELRKYDWAPRRVRRRGREIAKAVREVEGETGRSADMDAVARRLDITAADLSRDMDEIQASFILPLESLTLTGEDGKPYARLDMTGAAGASPDPAQAAEEEERVALVAQRIRALPEKERQALALYFQEGLTLKEIGRLLEVSESRVSQVMKEAVGKLREGLARRPGEEQA